MATNYNGKIVGVREMKKLIKDSTKIDGKAAKARLALSRMSIWFIGGLPHRYLYEGKILQELGEKYQVKVKARRLSVFEILEVDKKRIHFETV